MADRLIRRELSKDYKTVPHPSVQPLPESRFSEIIQNELNRCSEGKPFNGGIDLSRYEAPDEPEANSDIQTWRTSLRHAYTLSTYLSGRRTNLKLLEELGKNAWLIGNAELEGILKQLDAEVAYVKEQTDEVNKARKGAQEGSKGELLGLEDTWRKGIARMIEVQIATEQLKAELHEMRRVNTG
jgi:pre-mRNA-splicing factor SPF27